MDSVMTKTPRWLQSVLDASEDKPPHMSYERDNRPALELRRDDTTETAQLRAKA